MLRRQPLLVLLALGHVDHDAAVPAPAVLARVGVEARAQPAHGTVLAQAAELEVAIAPFVGRGKQLHCHPAAVARVDDARPEVPSGEPAIRRVAEHLAYARADEGELAAAEIGFPGDRVEVAQQL